MEFEQRVKAVFHNMNGELLLEELDKMYIQRMSYQSGNTPEETAFREGQRDVILFIKQLTEN